MATAAIPYAMEKLFLKYKLIYSMGGDLFNQCPNVNKMVNALDDVEFIVGQVQI